MYIWGCFHSKCNTKIKLQNERAQMKRELTKSKGTDEIWKYKEGKPILIVEARFKYFIIYLSSSFLQIPTSSLRGVTENKELRTETATSEEFSTSNRWSNSKIFPSVKRSQPWRRCFCTACLTASGESYQTGEQCTL